MLRTKLTDGITGILLDDIALVKHVEGWQRQSAMKQSSEREMLTFSAVFALVEQDSLGTTWVVLEERLDSKN